MGFNWQTPMFTRNCCWCLGYDLLKESGYEIGVIELPYNELGGVKNLQATIRRFELDGKPLHAAFADYRGGIVCWVEED